MAYKNLSEEEFKKLVNEIVELVRKYGNTTLRARIIRRVGGKPYLTSINVGKIFKDTNLHDSRYVRIDYIKTSDTVIAVFKKVSIE